MNKILVINTGSTSTKLALFHDEEAIFVETIRHPKDSLDAFENVMDQYSLREKSINDILDLKEIDLKTINAVVGRGGFLHPMTSGTYSINDLMIEHLQDDKYAVHASNLACLLAAALAKRCNALGYTVDPIVVDEMADIARITGCKGIERYCIWHALNQKAVAKDHAQKIGRAYSEVNLVVAHIGGGASIGTHLKGRVVEVTNALSGEGPFTAERAGRLPSQAVLSLYESNQYSSMNDMKSALNNKMGLMSLLGTNDGREVAARIENGDEQAKKVYRAMAYQIAKEIGSVAVVLKGDIDGILLTGGFAYDETLMSWVKGYVDWMAPVTIIPGEDEMSALANGVLRVLRGEEELKEYAV